MAAYIQKGETIDIKATADTNAEDVVVLGNKAGVAACSGKNGELIAVAVEGVYKFPKEAEAVSVGDDLYYDASAEKVTKTSGEGKAKVGFAVSDASTSDSEVAVKLSY